MVDPLNLDGYYQHVQTVGNLRTKEQAQRWSAGVLKTLGTTLDRGAKRALGKDLPGELRASLNGVFWLLHFRNPNLSSRDFQQQVARRSGNTDFEFARIPVIAVFGGLKPFLNDDVQDRVARSLSPEVRALWESARPS